jgi:16S rRNA (cytosine967-C5)-methyltransferase
MDALGPRGRALASRLVLGATSASGEIDRRVASHIKRPSHVEPRVADAFRVSAFEVLYLDTPRSVAVSQGVELVRRVQPRAAGMANAVLRRLAEQDRPEMDAARDRVRAHDASVRDLAATSGLPDWIVERAIASVGIDATCDMCLCQLDPAPVYVAPNLAICDPERTHDLLGEAGLDPLPTPLPTSFSLGSPAGLAGSGLVEGVDVVVCDLGSQVSALIATPAPGSTMLEVGAGRATKTILLESGAYSLGGPAELVCLDSAAYKVRIARERVSHGWADHVHEVVLDATTLSDVTAGEKALPEGLRGPFDTVLVDAPCSGTGTMRRHPEIPWSLTEASLDPSDPASLPALQLRILEASSAKVASGGELVYATCSVLTCEDEDVVASFLASDAGRDFSRGDVLAVPGLAGASESTRAFVRERLSSDGDFRSCPEPGGCDGHFCCRLVRS